MFDDFDDFNLAPMDGYDLTMMGLRAPRCNGCTFAKLQYELGDKFLRLSSFNSEWVNVYQYDAEPHPGQSEPYEHDGRPIRFKAGYMSIGHSDECYNWQPPKGE